MSQLYRVFYEETISYEDYVEAESSADAKKKFAGSLTKGALTPIDMNVDEFEAEVCLENN